VGHTTNWEESYGVIEDVQDYNLDKPVAAATLLSDAAEPIIIAKQRGGPAKLVLALEPEQDSKVIGVIDRIEKYNLTKVASPEAGRRTRLKKSTQT
jgi:hypothetical protein